MPGAPGAARAHGGVGGVGARGEWLARGAPRLPDAPGGGVSRAALNVSGLRKHRVRSCAVEQAANAPGVFRIPRVSLLGCYERR